MASVADDAVAEILSDDKNQQELVFDFVDMILNETPRGEMKEDDVLLLREIMADFPSGQKGTDTAQVVESLLYRLLGEWEAAVRDEDDERERVFRPTTLDFASAIYEWEKSADADRVVHVLSLLSDQRELFTDGIQDVKPTLAIVKSVLRTLTTAREKGLDRRATVVFDSIDDYDLFADAEIYELMISIIAKSRARGAGERAEKLLKEAVKKFPPEMIQGKAAGISVEAFNAVVTAYAKSGDEAGPEKAEGLIVYMDQIDTENGSLGVCAPTINTFTSLIDAYGQRNEWEAASQADRILNQLLDQYLEGNDDLEPNIATWTIVINSWARLSKKNRKGAAERAGRLLKRMEDLYEDGKISCKPDAIAYVTCMNAYAFSKQGLGASEAERILDEMNENYLDGDDTMKPSPRSIKIVLESWVKCANMERAEDLLDKYEMFLEHDNPEVFEVTKEIYKSILFGYTQQENPERARSYLEYMLDEDMEPDSFCFERVIDSNTRKDPKFYLKSSVEIFELMEKAFRAGKIEPNERLYTTFIRAITKAKTPGMHAKADLLLQRMKRLHEKGHSSLMPTTFTYNAVLFACAESVSDGEDSTDDAFKTAVRTFTEMRNGRCAADHVTYGNMIRCGNLLPDGEKKLKFVSATFRLCCENGFLNDFVLRDMFETLSEDQWRPLVGDITGSVEIGKLPSKWSRMIDPPRDMSHNEKRGRQRKYGDK